MPKTDPRSRPPSLGAAMQDESLRGLRRFGGYVREDPLEHLNGRQGRENFRQMETDATVGSFLFILSSVLRGVGYQIRQSEDESTAAINEDCARFFESVLDDMAHGFDEFRSQLLRLIPVYGFAPVEPVLMRRDGRGSKHGDGMIGIRELRTIHPDTVERWEFTDAGEVVQCVQRNPYTGRTATLDMGRLVNFRSVALKGNPEGLSLLRPAYKAWYFKSKMEDYEAIQVSRDASGVLDIQVPAEVLAAQDADTAAILSAIRDMAAQYDADERAYFVRPAEEITDTATGQVIKTGYKLATVASNGGPRIEANIPIQRYRSEIYSTVAMQFLALGQGGAGGSLALGEVHSDYAERSMAAILDVIEDTINRQLIPYVMRYNAGRYPAESWPTLDFDPISDPSVDVVSQALERLARAGLVTPDDRLESHVRSIAGLPERDEDDYRAALGLPGETDRAGSQIRASESSPPDDMDPLDPLEDAAKALRGAGW